MNKDEVKKEIDLQLKNAKVLDCKYVTVSVETLKFIKKEAFQKAKKPVWQKELGELCPECETVVHMDENYCSHCGCELDWEGLMDECF